MANKYMSYVLAVMVLVSCKASTDQLIAEGGVLMNKGDNRGAIEKYEAVITRNSKLQLAFYNQAICYSNLKKYDKALYNINKILAMHGNNEFEFVRNPDGLNATDEDRAYIPGRIALFERAKIKFYMDSLNSSFYDFKTCLESDYDKNECYLWIGTIYIRLGNKSKGCELYKKANPFGNNEDAIKLIKGNCN